MLRGQQRALRKLHGDEIEEFKFNLCWMFQNMLRNLAEKEKLMDDQLNESSGMYV